MLTIPLILTLSMFLLFLLPYAPAIQGTSLSFGLLLIFVILSFMPGLVFIGGVATGNKFAEISAQRSVLMLVSYELPLILIIASFALPAGSSFNIANIVTSQQHMYYALLMPIGLVVFFIAMLAELERPPFDIREADSELIAGWFTDYSSPYYAPGLLSRSCNPL